MTQKIRWLFFMFEYCMMKRSMTRDWKWIVEKHQDVVMGEFSCTPSLRTRVDTCLQSHPPGYPTSRTDILESHTLISAPVHSQWWFGDRVARPELELLDEPRLGPRSGRGKSQARLDGWAWKRMISTWKQMVSMYVTDQTYPYPDQGQVWLERWVDVHFWGSDKGYNNYPYHHSIVLPPSSSISDFHSFSYDLRSGTISTSDMERASGSRKKYKSSGWNLEGVTWLSLQCAPHMYSRLPGSGIVVVTSETHAKLSLGCRRFYANPQLCHCYCTGIYTPVCSTYSRYRMFFVLKTWVGILEHLSPPLSYCTSPDPLRNSSSRFIISPFNFPFKILSTNRNHLESCYILFRDGILGRSQPSVSLTLSIPLVNKNVTDVIALILLWKHDRKPFSFDNPENTQTSKHG